VKFIDEDRKIADEFRFICVPEASVKMYSFVIPMQAGEQKIFLKTIHASINSCISITVSA
jgi:hypothetical protein